MAISPTNPNVFYFAGEAMDDRRGVFRSNDGGVRWQIDTTSMFASSIGGLAVSPADSTIVFAGAKRYGTYSGNGVFKSLDSGNAWTFLKGTEGAGPIVAVDPISPEIVYTTTGDWGILKSTDVGHTWFEVWRGWGDKRIGGIEVDHHRAGTLFVVKEEFDHALYRSDDGGETWVELTLPDVAEVYQVDSDPRIPGVVYASTELGLFRSTDWGESWSQSAAGLETPEGCRLWGCGEYWRVTEVTFDPSDADVLYASTEVGPYRSTNGGSTWELISEGMLFCCGVECDALTKSSGSVSCEGGPLGFAVDPDRPSTVFMSTSLGTYRSYNKGARWERITGPDQINPKAIVAAGNGLLLGASVSAGVLRLETSPVPPPRRPGRRASPNGSRTPPTKIDQYQE
ncbi:MAG: WD40/YVTN/BNR-like repeat-containing protein [Thermoanaerobaculales bacterium]